MEIVAAPDNQGEMRLDSRALADRMGNAHASVMKLLGQHTGTFRQFGQFGFEIETVKNSAGAANQTKYALLNEDQCYFLLTLVRNSDTTVPMKAAVVAAFAKARQLLKTGVRIPDGQPAFITARGVAAGMGCSRTSAQNRIAAARIKPAAHYRDDLCKNAGYLYPLDAVQTRWPDAPFEPYTGKVLPGLGPVARHVAVSRTGKSTKHLAPQPAGLPLRDMDVDTLARVIAVAVKAALA